jgi:hypothetical protein
MTYHFFYRPEGKRLFEVPGHRDGTNIKLKLGTIIYECVD